MLKEALPIERELYPEDIQTARTLEALSNLLIRREKGREALPLAEEALKITIHAAGEDSVDTALAYSCVAEAHRFAGSPERALPLYRKARSLYEKTLGPDHPRVASLLEPGGPDPDAGRQTLAGRAVDGAGRDQPAEGVSGLCDGAFHHADQSRTAAFETKTLSRGGRGVDHVRWNFARNSP